MSYHVTGFCPGRITDPDRIKTAWANFVRELDEASDGGVFEGFVAGGDWVGDDRGQRNAFKLTADEVRRERA